MLSINGQDIVDIPDEEWNKMMCEYNFDPQAHYEDPNSPYFVSLFLYHKSSLNEFLTAVNSNNMLIKIGAESSILELL